MALALALGLVLAPINLVLLVLLVLVPAFLPPSRRRPRVRLLLELSAEHPTLPRAELEALCDIVGARVEETDRALAFVEAPDEAVAFFRERPGLAHSVLAHWWSSPATPRAVVPPFGRIALKGERFAIRGRRLEGLHPEFPLQDTIVAAGGILAVSGKVDLKDPELVIQMLVAEDVHVGALLGEVDRKALDRRHVKHRAHFAPVSLHPRYARALVNLARVRPGDRVADPFCGTGGILIEAGLVGARAFGSDLDGRMVEGTRATLAQMGVEGATVETRDVGELPEFAPQLDAVVTDPPYGRSSTTNQEDIVRLYDRFVDAAHEALKPGGRLAFITASPELRDRALRRFRLEQTHEQRVHRSMTRYWGVYVKEGGA
ncbi:MAG TPA: TRM11 family methyltransferase [Candidatus Thermoplasmatota archaeon]|nr:TRM11 family methyltransferase [Candidatus Thermoplasmatota archaeon]